MRRHEDGDGQLVKRLFTVYRFTTTTTTSLRQNTVTQLTNQELVGR